MNASSSEVPRKIDTGSLITGSILIGVGTLFLLDQFDVAEFGDVVRRYWPMIFVLIGLPKLFRREKLWSGLWLITLGVWLQIARLQLFGLTFRTSWPLLLIALGAGITLRALMETAAPKEEERREP